jgi:hypothetical protein
LPVEDLVFIDEAGVNLGMTRRFGRNTARLRKMGSKIKRKVFAGYLREI